MIDYIREQGQAKTFAIASACAKYIPPEVAAAKYRLRKTGKKGFTNNLSIQVWDGARIYVTEHFHTLRLNGIIRRVGMEGAVSLWEVVDKK